jgi:RNA polymerase sigma factor (sigma-70 family)
MAEVDDIELVREFADRDSQPAFAELVQRHVNLVYSVALRYAGNSADAQDITQAVFIILAKKAASLRHRKTLTGWLYETTRFMGVRLLRTRARRHAREQEAYMQSTLNNSDTDGVWRQVGPLLEEGMERLGGNERALLALRYFENKSGAETAALLGIQEWAAHKRTARALEKLRKFFAKRGVGSTTAAIAGAISANSVHAAPAALAKTAAAVALGQGAATGASTLTLAKGALKVMAWSTAKTAIVSALVVGMAALLVNQYQAQAELRAQNEALRQRMAQLESENEELARKRTRAMRLPAPQMQTTAAPAGLLKATNLLERLKDKSSMLTREQLESYLKANGRNAASLLAAFRTSRDMTLLKEAMEKFPNDPQVAFEAAFAQDFSPEERHQWLETFAQSAPDNALANYLSALDYFKAGQGDQALQELAAASGKSLDDYTVGRTEDDVEAYVAAGYSLAEAKATASMQILLPQLSEVKQMALDTVALANGYAQAGDTTSAQAALQMTMNVGEQYANPSTPTEINQLVGIAIEKIALGAMDPGAPYGDAGLTVQDQINQLVQQRETLVSLNQQAQPLMASLSDQDWIMYTDHREIFGEQSALQWVVNNFGQTQP